jgi:hypothetical protein
MKLREMEIRLFLDCSASFPKMKSVILFDLGFANSIGAPVSRYRKTPFL